MPNASFAPMWAGMINSNESVTTSNNAGPGHGASPSSAGRGDKTPHAKAAAAYIAGGRGDFSRSLQLTCPMRGVRFGLRPALAKPLGWSIRSGSAGGGLRIGKNVRRAHSSGTPPVATDRHTQEFSPNLLKPPVAG